MDEPLTAAAIRMAVDLTLRQHQPGPHPWQPGTCRQCTPDGCAQLAWAVQVRRGEVKYGEAPGRTGAAP
ncbi:hypothetical protein [Micromonospora sp. NBC_01796]|uniref:hypothetical protein n=1 Tax=Micromonospora sp. NBC_01796 TaxID=2975987 RepID=UPI002DD8633A|nr:hypothetical protein [Micromonospora sp. NBC_01796]WSA87328.1 hypothetical protein OIE47_06860 [Micromonospora sp. NBC_01796]